MAYRKQVPDVAPGKFAAPSAPWPAHAWLPKEKGSRLCAVTPCSIWRGGRDSNPQPPDRGLITADLGVSPRRRHPELKRTGGGRRKLLSQQRQIPYNVQADRNFVRRSPRQGRPRKEGLLKRRWTTPPVRRGQSVPRVHRTARSLLLPRSEGGHERFRPPLIGPGDYPKGLPPRRVLEPQLQLLSLEIAPRDPGRDNLPASSAKKCHREV
jgi:hypothetical protein